MAFSGLKMALIHPTKIQIGCKLDQNTNLVNTFENNKRKCKKVKIQWNMDDFHGFSRFFAEKWKYQNFDTKIYSTGCKG